MFALIEGYYLFFDQLCMGQVKAVADAVVASNDEDGLAEALELFVL